MKVTDTSAAQARKGKDIQGIPWERLNITRESYRLTRLEQYRNYENIPLSGEAVDKVGHLSASVFIIILFPIGSMKLDFLSWMVIMPVLCQALPVA